MPCEVPLIAITCSVVAVLVAALGWWSVPRLPAYADECWYLLVVRRVRQGRRLYRGVFFGAGPWSVWCSRLLVRWFGERLLVLRRAVVVLSLVVGGAVVAYVAALGVPWGLGLAVAAGTMAMSTALWSLDNAYGLWSRVGILVAFAAVLGIDEVWAAGLLGGFGVALALLNKYTLGVASVPGLLAVALAGPATPALLALGVGGVLAAAGYVVAARGGTGRPMARRLLGNKRTFVASAGVGFLAGWRATVGRPPGPSALEGRVSWAAFALTALAGSLVLVDLVVAVARDEGHVATAAVGGLALVGLASLWPRADDMHVRCALPLWTAPALVAADRLSPTLGLAWALLVSAAGLGSAVLAVAERRRTSLRGPGGTPFDGVNPWPQALDEVLAGGEELRRLTHGTVFLLRPDAAVWYLATGLRNPTPYDYPLASTFGPEGQQVAADNLLSGRVRFCCWVPAQAGALTPRHLEEVAASLPVVAHTVVGTLVTARPTP